MLHVLVLLIGVLLPSSALAAPASVVEEVGGSLPSFGGYNAMMMAIATQLSPIASFVAMVAIAIVGIRMIVAQEDDATEKGKAIINLCIAGLVMIQLIGPFVGSFFGVSGEVVRSSPGSGVARLTPEVEGLINFVLGIAGVVAVASIIGSGLRAIISSGSEEGMSAMRKTVVSVIAGILLLAVRVTIATAFAVSPTPMPIIEIAVHITSYILGFVALIAVAVIIFAGLQLITSLGSDEAQTKAKGLITRAAIGLLVVGVSFAIVKFVMNSFG